MTRYDVLHGDCLETMGLALEDDSVDAVVSDPPYGLAFMGKAWDHGVPGVPFWEETLRVMKPGAYLLAFGGTRTYHRLACAIEDAGFEVQDCLSWLYGSGFPKHKSKLKPAWEPIILARKPAPKATLLNVDACRIGFASEADERESKDKNRHADYASGEVVGYHGWDSRAKGGNYNPPGRWPANVVLDEDAAALLDAQSGEIRTQRIEKPCPDPVIDGHKWGTLQGNRGARGYSDVGGASRFFYCAKASRSERNAGLHDFAEKPLLWSAGTQNPGAFQSEGTHKAAQNHHPTVKPLALMRWLVRLVTPEGGLVLDPFTGSGTTGCAAVLEGRRFLGIEKEEEYATIARARIAHHAARGPRPADEDAADDTLLDVPASA